MAATWDEVTEGMEIPTLKKNCSTQQLVVWAAGSAPIRQHLHATESPWTVQIVQDGPRIVAVYLLDEEAFASNLNRMYLLGDYDTARFEPVFDDFPHTRVYRVRAPQNPAPRRLTPGGAG